MAWALPVAAAGVKIAGNIMSSNSQASALRSQAGQYDMAATNAAGEGQRTAIEQRRQADLLQSRARAVGAADGGSATDPTVLNVESQIAGEGEYRALTALYNGDTQAANYRAEAMAKRKEARNMKKSAFISSLGTLLDAGSSLQQKYG